jgi:hypothetical protein
MANITDRTELEQLRELLWRADDAKSRALADLGVLLQYVRTAPAELGAGLLARVQELMKRREGDAAAADENSASALATVFLGASDAQAVGTNVTVSRQKTSKWPDWESALAAITNPAIVEFFRQEVDAKKENYLPRRRLHYRVGGKRRWIVRGRTRYAYVSQEGRFRGDAAYWRGGLSHPVEVKAVVGNKVLRFRLYTEGDVQFFCQALTDKASVQWSDGKPDGELAGAPERHDEVARDGE